MIDHTDLSHGAAGPHRAFRGLARVPQACAVTPVLAALLLLAACGGEPATSGGTLVRDSAGVTLVRNGPAPGWSPEEAWWVEEVVRSRPDPGDPASELGYVVDAALAPDGRMYALDGQARVVRVFGVDGDFLGTVGGPGEGPGEFSDRVTSVEVVDGLDGPELWVLDGLRSTLHRFDLEGALLASGSLASGESAWSAWLDRGRDGRAYLRVLEYRQGEGGDWSSRDRLQRLQRLQPDAADEGAVATGDAGTARYAPGDTVLVFDYRRDDTGKNSGEFSLPPVVNAPAWAVTADGTVVWTALLDREIHVHPPDGNPIRVRSEAWIPREPSDDDRTVLRLLTSEMLRMTGSWKGDPSDVPLSLPEVLPVHTGLMAGPDGTVWAQRSGPLRDVHPMSMNTEDEPDGWGGSGWEVFDGDGRFLGTVELPSRFRVTDIRGDRIVGVRYDQNLVDQLMVLQIRRGEEAP